MAVSDNTKREMYITLLHLVHQKRSTYKELLTLLDRGPGHHLANNILGGIHRKIEKLENEWDDEIPKINALVFETDDNDTEVSPWVVTNVFNGIRPNKEQVHEYACRVKTYGKWNEVLEAFKYWK
ncbi:MAG: hypothetical protein OXU23_22125 [Candidatus Poribacteria bacterium]|nr:hypothetical protein [Candidatus Poribacteria bacterium]